MKTRSSWGSCTLNNPPYLTLTSVPRKRRSRMARSRRPGLEGRPSLWEAHRGPAPAPGCQRAAGTALHPRPPARGTKPQASAAERSSLRKTKDVGAARDSEVPDPGRGQGQPQPAAACAWPGHTGRLQEGPELAGAGAGACRGGGSPLPPLNLGAARLSPTLLGR